MNDIKKNVWKPFPNAQITSEHKCAYLVRKALYDNMLIVQFNRFWYFVCDIYADELSVYDGEAKKIGEYMCGNGFQILYCPFCGSKLDTCEDINE